MRRLLALLCALALTLCPVAAYANLGAGGGLSGFWSVNDRVDITYTATATDNANASSYSFSSQAIGDPTPSRQVVVLVQSRSGLTHAPVSALTIGGVAASLLVSVVDTAGSVPTFVEAWAAQVPTGTTATVAVTFTGTNINCAINVFAVQNARPGAAATATGITGTTVSASVYVPPNGGAIGGVMGGSGSGPGAVTWTGLTEDSDATIEAVNNRYSAAHVNLPAGSSSLSVSAQFTSAPAQSALAVVSFGPM